MTKEQEKATEILERIDVKKFISGMNETSNYIIEEADKVNQAIEIVLNMLKEKDNKIWQLKSQIQDLENECISLHELIDEEM